MVDELRRAPKILAVCVPGKGAEQDVCDEWWNTFRS
jgi:hypothetical protein